MPSERVARLREALFAQGEPRFSLLVEGIDVRTEHAGRLLAAAEALVNVGRNVAALFLLATSAEEFGKALVLVEMMRVDANLSRENGGLNSVPTDEALENWAGRVNQATGVRLFPPLLPWPHACRHGKEIGQMTF